MSSYADSLGWDYKGASDGDKYPWIATFKMKWQVDGRDLSDSPKGFLVGLSPELIIAWGSLAMFERDAGVLNSDRRPIKLDGGEFNLVVYPESLRECVNGVPKRGDQIRSMYPEFVRLVGNQPVPPQPANGLVIVRALINPSGDETGKEWVEIKNSSDAGKDLVGLDLCDRIGRRQALSGTLAPGAVTRIICTRATPEHPQLSNRNGEISIRKGDEVISTVSYRDTSDGEVTEFQVSGNE